MNQNLKPNDIVIYSVFPLLSEVKGKINNKLEIELIDSDKSQELINSGVSLTTLISEVDSVYLIQ